MAASPHNRLATALFAPIIALLFLWNSVRDHCAEGAFVPRQNVHHRVCGASSTERGGRIPPLVATESSAPSFHRGPGEKEGEVFGWERNMDLSRLAASTNPATTDSAKATTSKRNVIVVSPPGGVGEIAATSLAKLGHSVRYFVVSSDSSSGTSLAFPKRTWDTIEESGGELDVTAGSAESLLLPQDDPRGAGKNLEEWCAVNALSEAVEGIIVSLDDGSDGASVGKEESARRKELGDAVKLVTQTACRALPPSATRVEIVPIPSDGEEGEERGDDEGGLKKWLLNPLQSGSSITLREAVSAASSGAGSTNIFTVRHGELFGVPESNKHATPFLGGPRRDPIFREEYTQRSVLLSPTAVAVGQRRMAGGESAESVIRTSRLSLADAAVRSLLRNDDAGGGGGVDDTASATPRDFAVSSLRGSEPLTEADWTAEFNRLAASRARTMDGEGSMILFETSYDDVPNVAKLADWIAFKWAPTVLSTYDIAGIRKGARPVYATRVPSGSADEGKNEEEEEVVEIYWQELINFEETKTVGKMIIKVSKGGMVATRKALSAVSSGEGVLSPAKPFPGENVLVRRLADAAGQAAEKGLAVKRKVAKPSRETQVTTSMARTPAADAVAPAESLLGETSKATATTATVSKERRKSSDTGPRTSGAKRSSERRRGKRSTDRPGKKTGGK